ncbi:MAG TPA: hypothetical protein VJC04_01280 [Candidatus Paceibacterota bacterium]
MNFLEKIFKNRRWLENGDYHLGKNNIIDWLIMIGFFITLSVIFVALAFYQFSNYQKNETVVERSVEATSTAVLFNHAKLDEVVRYFAEREQDFNNIKNILPHYADPSR